MGFVEDGFVCVREAFPRRLAERIVEQLWTETSIKPADPSTWPGPVLRHAPTCPEVLEAASSPRLMAAVETVAGPVWPRENFGPLVARFPTGEDSRDTGWHIDSSYHPDDLPWPHGWADYRINVRTRGRALLLLALFTEVGEDDAPTRIRLGSHLPTAQALAPHGDDGVLGSESGLLAHASATNEVIFATGEPGDVYLCHPFLMHAAQLHRGTAPRVIAQPGVLQRTPYRLARDGFPVEQAIVLGCDGPG